MTHVRAEAERNIKNAVENRLRTKRGNMLDESKNRYEDLLKKLVYLRNCL